VLEKAVSRMRVFWISAAVWMSVSWNKSLGASFGSNDIQGGMAQPASSPGMSDYDTYQTQGKADASADQPAANSYRGYEDPSSTLPVDDADDSDEYENPPASRSSPNTPNTPNYPSTSNSPKKAASSTDLKKPPSLRENATSKRSPIDQNRPKKQHPEYWTKFTVNLSAPIDSMSKVLAYEGRAGRDLVKQEIARIAQSVGHYMANMISTEVRRRAKKFLTKASFTYYGPNYAMDSEAATLKSDQPPDASARSNRQHKTGQQGS
jgi:hypothetical protein